MTPEQFTQRVQDSLSQAEVHTQGEGCSFSVTIISPDFAGKLPLARHKMIYALVNDEIKSGAIHALTIKAYTPEEWAKQ